MIANLSVACTPDDFHLFFSPDHAETLDARRDRVAKAAAICGNCPARTPCRQFAVARNLRWGVWGGEDFERQPRSGSLCRNQLHLMTEANTWTDPDGGRNCRACRNERDQRTRDQKRSARAEARQQREKVPA